MTILNTELKIFRNAIFINVFFTKHFLFQNTNNYSVYTNSMIVCAVTIIAYIVASGVINKIGKRRLYGK